MTDTLGDARDWVTEQLRYPQRAPRTTAVFDWTGISLSTQAALVGLAGPCVDPTVLFARPPRWRTVTRRSRRHPQLTAVQRDELRRAYSPLHWPLREEGPETRLVAIAEDVIAHILTEPVLDGPGSALSFTVELHHIAATAHELLTLRTTTPPRPGNDGTDPLTRARTEWERRQVTAACAEAGLVDRVAALRHYQRALTAIAASLHTLRAVTELAAGEEDVDRLDQQTVESEYATEHTATLAGDVDDVHAGLDAELAYLDSLIRPHPDT
ncbi:hypothetical protein [Rhodococcus marinonascens]|uniref:hypothetical protein n=1 Tax=Rhodococcus marinonascens TaxID=38311 RepID=UPI001FE89BCD|nr:hypothetical protein [Rhodococcus marinonascens]